MRRATPLLGRIFGSRRVVLSWALSALLASACMGGQTGSEANKNGTAEAGGRGTLGPVTAQTAGVACTTIVGPDDSTEVGVSAAALVGILNELPALTLVWGSGETTTLAVGATLSSSPPCLMPTASGTALQASIDLTLTTADGRLSTTLAATAVTQGTAALGGFAIELSGSRVCQPQDPASTLQCGTTGLDLTGYASLGLAVSARLQPSADGTVVLGTLLISAAPPPTCPDPTSPCAAPPWTALQGASFGSG